MKAKKINTVPNGMGMVIIILFEIFLTLILGVVLLPKPESVGMFAFSLIFLIALADYINKKHWNFIYVFEDRICHGHEEYKWQDVYVTVKVSKPTFARNSYDHYIYFDDHYLTKEECESRAIRKKGFFMILTYKRAEWLFQLYQKRIKILNESPYRRSKKMMDQIKEYNLKYLD